MYWNSEKGGKYVWYHGLIETWDVLKCWYSTAPVPTWIRLIETWDVLKLRLRGEDVDGNGD